MRGRLRSSSPTQEARQFRRDARAELRLHRRPISCESPAGIESLLRKRASPPARGLPRTFVVKKRQTVNQQPASAGAKRRS